MATRVGIELSPAACRVIEIEGGLPWVRRAPETTVLSFDVLPPAGPETRAKLETLRKRSAAVVVWGVPSDHRQVIVTNRSYEAMRREALVALTGAGIETRGVLADIAPAGDGKDRSPRRPVVVALAAAAPMTAALEPLTNAGIHVRSVLTPAAALTSLARTRCEFAVPGSIEAYVALDKTATCIALVRDGALITARELSWGYVDDVGHTEPRRVDDITRRLADELSEFFGAIGASPSAVGQICVCGPLPELRSMTARLTQQLDVEVEPLDSQYAIDSEELFEHSVDFRERSAEMRLAWAAATDWPPAINLLRARKRQSTKTALARAALVAGAVAGLAIGWQVQQSAWWRSRAAVLIARVTPRARPAAPATRAPQPTVSPKPPPSPGSPGPSPATTATKTVPPATPPSAAATKPPTPVSPPVVATKPPTPATTAPTTPPVSATKPLPPPVTTMKPSPPVSPPIAATKTPVPTTPAPTTPPVAAAKPSAPPATTTQPAAPVSPPIAATKTQTQTPPSPSVAATKPAQPPVTTTKPSAPVSPPIAATKTPAPATPPVTAAKPSPPPVTTTKPTPPVSPPIAATKPTAPVSPPIAATKPAPPSLPPSTPRSSPAVPPGREVATPPPTSAPPAARREPERAPTTRTEPKPTPTVLAPAATPPRAAPSVAPPPPAAPSAAPPVRPQPPVEPSPPARRDEPAPEPAPRRVAPARPPEVATPFDASLATILYSPDRKLAIIDGRIVGVGDEVRGARVTDITPNAVFLRDAQGRLRRLSR
ncbi:MAG TPA: hypothetical protein VGQ16_13995 [Vicinamibacterales bacterium]|nr:hypothetical protein [Vicinamibacterales bacterium]